MAHVVKFINDTNKWTLELISSFSRPGLVKFNKIYTEEGN